MKISVFLTLSVGLLLAVPAVAQSPADESPLAAYPGFGHDAESDDARFAREELARENMIARCMEQHDFIYHPRVSLLLEDYDSPSQALNAQRNNPNGRYVRGLSEDERLRYTVALHGVENPLSEDAADHPDPNDLAATGGCFGTAMATLPGVYAAKAELQDEYDALRRAVMGDLRVKLAEVRWASCMKRAGHELDGSPRALEERQDTELGQLLGRTKAQRAPDEALAALGEVHRAERQLTMKCARETDLAGAVARVRVDHETRFVAAHRELLDQHLQKLDEQTVTLDWIEAAQP